MARHVLIIHGWSDSSASFVPLARFLAAHGYAPKMLWLGDYISKSDEVRVQDVASRMNEVIQSMLAKGELAAPFDVIVHSTGGLVARAWLTAHWGLAPDRCPMKRLVMLAPANYGSKLAATGKSFLGRVVKGYDSWFQTGQAMLDDLELASPFQWELAQRDVLVAPGAGRQPVYGSDRVWPFVISGTHGYTNLLRRVANENGADGTVRACAANLNARGVTLDLRQPEGAAMFREWELQHDFEFPLAVLPTRTHGSIIDPDRAADSSDEGITETRTQREDLGALILEALACPSFDEYLAIGTRWAALSETTCTLSRNPPKGSSPAQFHQYMQLNAYVIDDQGKPVGDYFLEFFSNRDEADDEANVYLHREVLECVRINSRQPAVRNFYFDRTDLVDTYYREKVPPGVEAALWMSIAIAPPGPNVSYFDPRNPQARQKVAIHVAGDKTARWLRRNTTHFLQIIVPRRAQANVFRLRQFPTIPQT